MQDTVMEVRSSSSCALKATGWKKTEYYGDGSGEPQDSLEGHVFAPVSVWLPLEVCVCGMYS